jgi:GNAT superfamily N-acetyltransferase
MFHLRAVDPDTDFERVAELMRLVWPPDTAQKLEEAWRVQQDARVFYTLGCDAMGRIAGVGQVTYSVNNDPESFRIRVVVDPADRRQGLGSLICEEVQRYILALGGQRITAFVWDNCPECARFAEKHGYNQHGASFISVLDMAGFDESHFAGVIEHVQSQGIIFVTLADFGDTEEARRKCFEANNRTMAPAFEGAGSHAWPSFEVFAQRVCESSWYRSDGQIVAIDKSTGEWIGLGAVGFETDGVTAFNAYTGVDPRYRGRDIALALKLLGVRCARRHGCATLRANNAMGNAPMLAINNKLGYARLGKILYCEKTLNAGASE